MEICCLDPLPSIWGPGLEWDGDTRLWHYKGQVLSHNHSQVLLKHFPPRAQPPQLVSGDLRKVHILQSQALIKPKPITKSFLTLITDQAHLQISRKMQQALTREQLPEEGDAICVPRKWKCLLGSPCFRRDNTTERTISTQTFQIPSKPNSSVCVVVLPQICQHLPSTKIFVNFPCSAAKEAITKSLQVFLLLRNAKRHSTCQCP